jgi:cobalamin-dependent methionine synthase I
MAQLYIIGEKLNSSNPRIKRLFRERDEDALAELAQTQIACGAECIDLNASMLLDEERDALFWSARFVRNTFDADVSLDSPNLDLLLDLAPHFGEHAVLNSLTSDDDALDKASAVIFRTGAGAVVMLKDIKGIPDSAAGRLHLAEKSAEKITKAGIPAYKIYFDPVFYPLATSPGGLSVTLETLVGLRSHFSDFRTIGGLSNVSFGLPLRKLLNRTFLAMSIACGLTAAICDPTDKRLLETLRASEALAGMDSGCRRFLKYFRDT